MIRAATWVLVCLVLFGCGDDADPDGQRKDAPGATKIALDRYAQAAVPGFRQAAYKIRGPVLTSSYEQIAKTAGGATLQVRVTLSPCEDDTCAELVPDPGRDHMRLRRHLDRKHASNPQLVWDAGHVELTGGRKGLFLYTRSYMEEKQSGGGTRRLAAHFFEAWYHDGRRLIDFAVEAKGGRRVTSDSDLASHVTPEEAKAAVQAVFATFADAFEG